MSRITGIGTSMMLAGAFASGAAQATPALWDYGFNVDGDYYGFSDPLPPQLDASGFDFVSGLGTLTLTLTGVGSHNVDAVVDHDLTSPLNPSYINEIGAAKGIPAPGQSWEIDEPGYAGGDIFVNLANSSLDNAIGVSIFGSTEFPDDVSMGLGWDFMLTSADEVAIIEFILTDLAVPSSGFYLVHSDAESDESIYFTSTLEIRSSGVSVPEPSVFWLMGAGLVGFISSQRLRRS